MSHGDEENNEKALKRREQDYADYSNELAGRSTKIARFFSDTVREEARAHKKREGLSELLTALELALQDPVYAVLYGDVMDQLGEAERQTERALEQARTELEEAELDLSETLNSANRLPDGTVVFKDAEGNVWTDDGRLVEGEELDQVVWRQGNGATYEEYLRQRHRVEQAGDRIDILENYQVDTLGRIRDRMEDEESPPTKEELEEYQTILERMSSTETRPVAEPDEALDETSVGSVEPVAKPTL